MFKGVLIVGLGGFLGSASRYMLTQLIHKLFSTNFPLGTLLVNIVGCLIIGFLLGIFEKGSLISPQLWLFLTVGFCGGFTTFSTFSADSVNMINDREVFYLISYIGISVFAGISCTFLGKFLANYIWSLK
ncbi:MAG: fluoride efflux transporter CrcB [bacterium]